MTNAFPVIQAKETGRLIRRLRRERNISMEDMAEYFGFTSCRTIYKWQRGDCLPSLDNFIGLSRLFDVRLEELLVVTDIPVTYTQCAKDH